MSALPGVVILKTNSRMAGHSGIARETTAAYTRPGVSALSAACMTGQICQIFIVNLLHLYPSTPSAAYCLYCIAGNKTESSRSLYLERKSDMSKEAAHHHKQAAEHHEHAARHHHEAAKHHEAGNHEKAAHHAHLAHAHHVLAAEHAENAAKEHLKAHGTK